jgi:hypothetical protein
MSAHDEYNEADMGDDGGNAGPGAPTPLSTLEVCVTGAPCPYSRLDLQG